MKISIGGILTTEESIEILKCKFPRLTELLPLIMKLFERACSLAEFVVSSTMRNLVRLCRRLEAVIGGQVDGESGLDEQLRRFLLLEVADCFAGHLPHRLRMTSLDHFSDVLGLTVENVASLTLQRKPLVELQNDNYVQVGRVAFPSSNTLVKMDSGLAPTTLSLQIMEKVAVAVKMNEPVLLVGETGTGKTTIVQHLAQLLAAFPNRVGASSGRAF
jgi:midasin (ATPase involved in ribosome maturation)